MAKTRAQRAKLFAEESKQKEIKKKPAKPAKPAKVQSQINKNKKSGIQVTADLLKLCRPLSICLSRIKPNQSNKFDASK